MSWSLSQAQPAPPQTPEQNEIPTVPRQPDAFTPATLALRDNNLLEAARLLREMKQKGLEATQFNRWEILASRVALRQGDMKWLQEINEGAGLGDTANEV